MSFQGQVDLRPAILAASEMKAYGDRLGSAMARKQTRLASKAITGNSGQALPVEELIRLSGVALERESELDGVLLEDVELAEVEATSVRLSEVGLRRVNLNETRLRNLRLLDVLATAVEATNASWPYVRMSRVTFQSSALVGLDLNNAQLSGTTFSECKLDLASLRMSSIQDVLFVDCSLRGADFYGAHLRSVRFSKCELHETDFNQASLEMVDLRTSALGDIRGAGSLKGAIVDGSQLIELAPLLAGELGIRVEGLGEEA